MLSHILSFMPYNQPTIAEGGLWVKEVINRELIVGFDRQACPAPEWCRGRATQNSLRGSKSSPTACHRHDEGAVEEPQQDFARRSGETSCCSVIQQIRVVKTHYEF